MEETTPTKTPPGAVVTFSHGNRPDPQGQENSDKEPEGTAPRPAIVRDVISARDDETLSLPLYISGLVVALAGILAIDAEVGSPQFTATTVLLTVLGFVFSYAYRWMRFNPRYLHGFAAVVIAVLGYGYLTSSFNVMALMPSGVTLPADLMMAVFLEWLLVVRSWMLLGDGEVAFSAVFSISIIGLVSVYDIDATVMTDFFIYVVAAVFLLLHHHYMTQQAWSGTRERGRPAGRMVRTQLVLAGVCGFATLLFGTIVVTPIAMVGSHLSLGGALRTLMSVYKDQKNDTDFAPDTVSFSDDPDFSIGTGNVQGGADTTVLLHVRSSDNQPHYWRGRTYDRYMGNAWVSSLISPLPNSRTVSPDIRIGRRLRVPGVMITLDPNGQQGGMAALPPPVRDASWSPQITSVARVMDGHTHTLYTPSYPHQIVLPAMTAYSFSQSQDGDMTADEVAGGFTYYINSYGGTPSAAALRASKLIDCPQDVRETFINQKGDNVDSTDRNRLLDVTQGIVASLPTGNRDEFDMAEAIRKWVSQRCLYSLSVPPVPSGQDSVSYFLFDSRKGYCDLFASSMAILCRYAGIPARVVTGFDQGVPASDGGYDLRAMDKHAWVEVFFPGQGWYPYDPTAGAVADNSSETQNQPEARSIWNAFVGWMQKEFNANGPIAVALFIVIIVSLGYVVKSEVADPFVSRLRSRAQERRLALSGLSSAEQAGRAWEWIRLANATRYAKMGRLLSQAGLSRLLYWTPREYEADLQSRLPDILAQSDPATFTEKSASALAAIASLTEDFALSRYAPQDDVAMRLLQRERQGVGDEALRTLLGATRRIRWMGLVRRLLGRAGRVEQAPTVTASATP
jgi:hypothetical protein